MDSLAFLVFIFEPPSAGRKKYNISSEENIKNFRLSVYLTDIFKVFSSLSLSSNAQNMGKYLKFSPFLVSSVGLRHEFPEDLPIVTKGGTLGSLI
jgi:hypothetical protein